MSKSNSSNPSQFSKAEQSQRQRSRINTIFEESLEQGEIFESSNNSQHVENHGDSSSQLSKDVSAGHMEEQRRKRESYWIAKKDQKNQQPSMKATNGLNAPENGKGDQTYGQQNGRISAGSDRAVNANNKERESLTKEEIRERAFDVLEKTNKRVMVIRKKNEKRMQDLEKIRMAQQPYLTNANTHFRGNLSQYAIITHDDSGKAFYHPKHSLRVGQMRLDAFIQKNIKEEQTSNYLNEVVKFQNYAYQQRKKRRHNYGE